MAPPLACSSNTSCGTGRGEDVPEDVAVGPVVDAADDFAGGPAEHLAEHLAGDPAVDPAVDAANSAGPAPLDVAGDQRYLGHGIFVPDYKFMSAKKHAPTDSRFCGLLLRQLYTNEEMINRSVTGQPSRRNLKKGAEKRKPLTPTKVEAVKVGLTDYIRGRKTAVADGDRLDKLKTILSNFFSDKNRPEREPRKPKPKAGAETLPVEDSAV
ncbi:uncharacterized protein LOC120848815 [Ixodes scapularis]|uniref:uncharacterized protein LOC120848815 n=1 Tax=Ixodes scapularis TaxID=6945 RepID=UPI001C39445A|nr:uncharacterized protein LOC120848815 [Ixodes scapularis]